MSTGSVGNIDILEDQPLCNSTDQDKIVAKALNEYRNAALIEAKLIYASRK